MNQLQNAIQLLTGAQAYETPLAEDVIERLAIAARDSGFMSQGGFTEAAKLNPISTLLKWVQFSAGSAPPVPPVTAGDLTWGPGPVVTVPFLAASNDALGNYISQTLLGLPTTSITEFTFRSLVSSPGLVSVSFCNTLTKLSFPELISVGDFVDVESNSNLTLLSLPKLVNSVNGINTGNCPLLTSVDVSSLIPTDAGSLTFVACALDAASVELILRRCVLAGVTTCTISMAGGTNAGLASLSAQGQADAVTLGTQLIINP